jgi:hypothetical protein
MILLRAVPSDANARDKTAQAGSIAWHNRRHRQFCTVSVDNFVRKYR